MPPPPEFWDSRYAPLHSVVSVLREANSEIQPVRDLNNVRELRVSTLRLVPL